MCGICSLPTTHASTISTISLIPVFILVFWTFIWAWWMVTKMRVTNYFLDTALKLQALGRSKGGRGQ